MREAIESSAVGAMERTSETGQQSFRFAEEFIGFAGHFPGSPILPAVLQTLMSQMVAEQIVGEQLRFLSLGRAKFTAQLRPGDLIEVRVGCKDQQGQFSCVAELSVAGNRAASFTLTLGRGLQR